MSSTAPSPLDRAGQHNSFCHELAHAFLYDEISSGQVQGNINSLSLYLSLSLNPTSLLRLHFHDCFVNGCAASILLDPTPTIDSAQLADPNNNSARGFEVIDQIKAEVDKACGYSLVSCANILAVAARDSVVALGGPSWEVQLGRRDSTMASRTAANNDIPAPNMDLPALINTFQKQGLDSRDLVALSGAHTIGFAQRRIFTDRIYNNTNIIVDFAGSLQSLCPRTGEDSNLAGLDPSPAQFDALYFHNLLAQKVLLHSDQALYSGGSTTELVKAYSDDVEAFWNNFAKSMVKMGNIKPLIGSKGQIRLNCGRVN
ncbi:peroxidase P7-like [Rhodamnia argentea]|uniref:Peroxidase n=1 Tax=Rhodamnia argentea TaxID=178133 RepID=A0A8B8Q444_9MYRT|nr:peroxidase P7-like [Rhodamnia argentea]